MSIVSGGLATSGIGSRHWTLGGTPVHHLVDPSTGLPTATPWRTVTVAAASSVDANTASTAAHVLGDTAPSWLADRALPARLVAHDGSVDDGRRLARRSRPAGRAPMTPVALVAASPTAAAIGGKAFWFLTRASGLVAIVLLSATIVLGVVASVGWTTARWPRFLSQDVHRNLSLLCLAFVGVHVVTTVADGYVPIGFLDTVLPFRSPYRPLYLGLGALCLDLLLAVLVTSALRHRIGYGSWRFVHWLAYLCWPIALIHGLGSGTDTPLPIVLAVEAACTVAVLAAFAWRLGTGRTLPVGPRLAAAVGAVVVTMAIAGFALLGPLRPGWSHRSGTSSALLAQLASKNGAPAGVAAPATGPSTTTPTTAAPLVRRHRPGSRACPSPVRSPGPRARPSPTPGASSGSPWACTSRTRRPPR